MTRSTILVTGATGFIGRQMCAYLQKQGIKLRTLGRTRPEVDAEFIHWDMTGAPDADALAGVDTVYHLAGKAHALAETRQDESEYFRINTEATRMLLEACKKQGVHTFVYFSSVKAAGDSEGVMDERAGGQPDTPYGRAKRASEELVLQGAYVPHPVVIRLSMVYGNTKKGNLPRMIRGVQAGRFPPLPEFDNRRSMVHVDDVVQAAILSATRPEAAGKVYIVTDGESYSTRQMYEWVCEALNKRPPGWYLPLLALKSLAKAGDFIGSLRGRRFIFDSDALEKLVGSACYSSAKIERELGYRAKRKLREALPEIVQFLGLAG